MAVDIHDYDNLLRELAGWLVDRPLYKMLS